MLTPSVKLWLKAGKTSVIGAGRAKLLRAIEKHGSIKHAALAMNMSYRHAWGIIRQIRDTLGDEILKVTRGGATGGGAKLSELGRQILTQYEEYEREINRLLKYGPRPALAVDGVIINHKNNLVLIRRKNPPFKGQLALPGGFVEYNETTKEAVIREVKEELGIESRIKRLIGVYSDANRDPRQHVVSVVYELEPLSKLFKAGDDATSFEWISIHNLANINDLAFDHALIISDAITGIRKI